MCQSEELFGVGDGCEGMPLVFIDTQTRRYVTEGNPETIYTDLAEGRGVRAYALTEARHGHEPSSVRGLLRRWTRGRRDDERSERRSLARELRVHPAFTLSHVVPDAPDE